MPMHSAFFWNFLMADALLYSKRAIFCVGTRNKQHVKKSRLHLCSVIKDDRYIEIHMYISVLKYKVIEGLEPVICNIRLNLDYVGITCENVVSQYLPQGGFLFSFCCIYFLLYFTSLRWILAFSSGLKLFCSSRFLKWKRTSFKCIINFFYILGAVLYPWIYYVYLIRYKYC